MAIVAKKKKITVVVKDKKSVLTSFIEVVKMKDPRVVGWMNIYEGVDSDNLQNTFVKKVAHGGHVHDTKDQADEGAAHYFKRYRIRRLYCIKLDLK